MSKIWVPRSSRYFIPSLEAPVADKEEAEDACRIWSLKVERRILQQIPGLETRLETVAFQSTEPMLKQKSRTLKRSGIGSNLKCDERVRLDVLACLELRTPQETANVTLHISGSDVEEINTERSRCLSRQLICQYAERDRGKLARCELGTRTNGIVTRRNPRAFELHQR